MQICWTWQKVKSEDDRGFQRFLDNVQYKCSGILRYERVFGLGYVSTGGIGMLQRGEKKIYFNIQFYLFGVKIQGELTIFKNRMNICLHSTTVKKVEAFA